jgi:hypothetical protein
MVSLLLPILLPSFYPSSFPPPPSLLLLPSSSFPPPSLLLYFVDMRVALAEVFIKREQQRLEELGDYDLEHPYMYTQEPQLIM